MNVEAKHRSYNYWKCQLVGWSVASLYWAYVVYFRDEYSLFHTFVNFVFDVAIGITLTHLYKSNVRQSQRRDLTLKNIVRWALAILVLAFLFMLLVNIKWYVYWSMIRDRCPDFLASIFFWDPPFITGLRLMTIWVLAYQLYQYHKQKIDLTLHNAELSILAKQIQIDHLSNQLNPHFLFNSLNSVKSLISEDPTKAKRSVDLLSELLRSSLYGGDHLITIENELQLVFDYIELEKLRFEERLQLDTEIDDNTRAIQIPFLSIQILVENALKHGIQKYIEGGIIFLKIKKESTLLKIVVQNRGELLPIDRSNPEGLGLASLKKRLLLQYQGKASFELSENSEGQVSATLIIPLT